MLSLRRGFTRCQQQLRLAPAPMGQLPSRVHELDRSKPVYVICATGNRSLAMTDLLRVAGFKAWSVTGGTSAWARSGRPVEGGLR